MQRDLQIHIVSDFSDALRGSELRALKLYEGLARRCSATLWSETAPDPRLAAFPIRRIELFRGIFPRGGTIAFVGAFFDIGGWFRVARPRRTVVTYNTYEVDTLSRRVADLQAAGSGPVEIVYASSWLREAVGLDGIVEPSFIDIDRFSPAAGPRPEGPFRVGRLSRDSLTKHHLPDVDLYRGLARTGCSVRLMGGTVLGEALGGVDGIELMPAGAEPPDAFLRGLDCFYYRTADHWLEASGRVVMEAMACGLPVVAHWRGGYSEWIEDGETGFLVEDAEEAFAVVQRLRDDVELRRRTGRAARAAMETLYSPEALERSFDFYCPRDGAGSTES